MIDWKTAIEPVIRVKYSSSSGKAFIHKPSNPVYPPLLPVTWNFNKFNVWKDKFDEVWYDFLHIEMSKSTVRFLGDTLVPGGWSCSPMEGADMG